VIPDFKGEEIKKVSRLGRKQTRKSRPVKLETNEKYKLELI
jgi:hypothetical protein